MSQESGEASLELTAAPVAGATVITHVGPTDESLMQAYQAGTVSAFDMLYKRHKDPLYRFLLRGCSNRATADELFQEVWMSVIRTRASYAPTARFTTYLFHLAHNRLIDHYRRQRPQVELDEELASGAPGPERTVVDRDRVAKLQRLLQALPLEQRTAILLQEERGLSLDEIAAVTGVGRETVKSRLRYALEKLRRGMGDA